MAQKQGGGKKARKPKKSQGKHGGGGKVKLTTLEKALIRPQFLNTLGDARRRRVAEKALKLGGKS